MDCFRSTSYKEGLGLLTQLTKYILSLSSPLRFIRGNFCTSLNKYHLQYISLLSLEMFSCHFLYLSCEIMRSVLELGKKKTNFNFTI